MPKKIPQAEFDSILQVIAELSDGGSLEEIRSALKVSLARRTLQRRLHHLVLQSRVVLEGRGRASRYRLPLAQANAYLAPGLSAVQTQQPRTSNRLVVSTEGEAIRQAVRAPVQSRQPTGYNPAFLDEYRPNAVFYLSPETRQHLRELGQLPHDYHQAETYTGDIFKRLLIDLSWNSSRLEGNTYSLLETARLIELGEATEGKDDREVQMILNHKAAIELLVKQPEEVGFNRYTILGLHALLSDNLLSDPQARGRLRSVAVAIGGTVYHPLEVPQLIDECFQQVLGTAAAISDPFEQAFFVMVHLPYLQPFEDVNKRVSRLAANLPLVRHNLCPLSFVDVSQRAYIDGTLGVYELNRTELLRDVFVWAYERSCARYSAVSRSLGEPDAFRLRYRVPVSKTVFEIVSACMDKKAAVILIRQKATQDIPAGDQTRFIEVVETEVMSLHEGNIARYRLSFSQFEKWHAAWNRSIARSQYLGGNNHL